MKKLMIAAASAAAMACTTFAGTWFDAKIGTDSAYNDWPTDTDTSVTISGQGTWTNIVGTTYAENVLTVETSGDPLTFTATDAKTISDGDVTITSDITFTQFDAEPTTAISTEAKGGVIVVGNDDGTNYYVMVANGAGDANVWQKVNDVEVKSGSVKVAITLTYDVTTYTYTGYGATYTVDGRSLGTYEIYVNEEEGLGEGTISAACFSGSGTVASLAGATEGGAEPTTFTIAAIENATIDTVEGATWNEELGKWVANDGVESVTVKYLANAGYFFNNGTKYATGSAALSSISEGVLTPEVENEIEGAAAKIGDVDYYTLQAAANVGGDIVVLTNITLTARVDTEKDATFDLNGKTITTTATCGNGSAFNVKSGTVTIKNGTIDGTAVTETECDAITVRTGATATLEDLAITICSKNGACAYAFDGGKVTIKSGTYVNNTTEEYQYKAGYKAMLVNQANVADQLVFIEGGSFKGQNPATGDDAGLCKTFLADGYKSVKDGDYWKVQAITYATLTITQVENCTIVVSNDTAAVESGAKFDVDEAVELTVYRTPAAGYELDGYEATETITMNENKTVTAAVKASASPVVPADDGTNVTPNGDGSVTIEENTTNPGQATITLNDTTTTIKVTSTIDTLTVNGTTPAADQIKVLSSNGTDITAACKMTTTGSAIDLSLNPDAVVKGVKVQPTAIEATEGTIADGAVATKAIPGLTYTLKRGTELGTYGTAVDSDVATTTTITLKDDTTKPTDKAFYVIEVTK